jgi:hypothetical protein
MVGLLLGRQCKAKFIRSLALAGKSKCALAAPAREITKTRTVRRGRRTMEKMKSATVFRLYYLGLAPYENARHFLGLSEPSWVNWTEQIRQRCGKELLGRTMFPPRKYFTSG